jgi:CheY-like chemotaxis protein
MPKGGELTLSTSSIPKHELQTKFPSASANHYVCVTVSDTGMGMDESTQKRIFEPFFTTKEQGQGTGLGLSVVYGVMASHEGFVDLTSKVNVGTSFHLYFPARESQIPEREFQEEESPIKGKNETVLIVEDEEALRMLLKFSLEQTGYDVITAVDGEDGLNKYLKMRDKISLVITDHGMPKLDGFNLTLKLKEVNPNTAIILASGYIHPEDREKFSQCGITTVIQKPYELSSLLRKVRDVLQTR